MTNNVAMINLFLLSDKESESDLKNSNLIASRSEFYIHRYQNSNRNRDLGTFIMQELETVNQCDNDFFIVCQDDELLTEAYEKEKLLLIIREANYFDADLIFGGVETFTHVLLISDSLFWVDNCEQSSFVIISKRFFKALFAKIKINRIQDLMLCTKNKFVVHPFISIKVKTNINALSSNKDVLAKEYRVHSSDVLDTLRKLDVIYSSEVEDVSSEYDLSSLRIPTYIINLENREDRLTSVIKEFENKPEFQTYVTKACVHDIGAIGLLNSIREIVKTAIINDDDVIIIVEDDHVFTEHYNRIAFIKNIIEAGNQGADILNGGISGGFQYAVPITEQRYWINHFWGSQFIVIYRKFFNTILETNFVETDTADDLLSNLSFNKMVLYPFISVQKDFGYSDITKISANIGDLSKIFVSAEKKIGIIDQAYQKFSKKK